MGQGVPVSIGIAMQVGAGNKPAPYAFPFVPLILSLSKDG